MKTPSPGWARIGRVLALTILAAVTATAESIPEGASSIAEVARDGGSPEGTTPLAAATASGVADESAADPALRSREPAPTPAISAVQRAWQAPAASLAGRVEVTRRAALEVGAWNLDPAARALIQGAKEGNAAERARGAVQLAPDLPAAHFAVARSTWLDGQDLMAVVRAVASGLQAIPRHAEASLWFIGVGLQTLALGLVVGGALAIMLAAVLVIPQAAHDFSHLWPTGSQAPSFAKFAGLAALLLIPLALGEGAMGLLLSSLGLGLLYASSGARFVLSLAALSVFAGLYPIPRMAGAALDAFPSDPVLRAAISTSHGVPSSVDIARLEHAVSDDRLAMQGLAIRARQTGNLTRAKELYDRILAEDERNLFALNNAANVHVDLGQVDRAIDLYGRALDVATSPVVLFNLSQTYGRTFQVDALNRTLTEAQRVDGALIAHFTALQRTKNEGFVVDLPIPVKDVWSRSLRRPAAGEALAAEWRRLVAPGFLGGARVHLASALGATVVLGWLLAGRIARSGFCKRCGDRQCARCDGSHRGASLCDKCNRLYNHPEKTERRLRAGRIESLRERERWIGRWVVAASMVVPGAAGWLAERPMRGFVGAISFALCAASVIVWRLSVADPLVAGAAAPVAFMGIAGIFGLLYLATVATATSAEGA